MVVLDMVVLDMAAPDKPIGKVVVDQAQGYVDQSSSVERLSLQPL